MIPKIIFQTYENKYENLPDLGKETSHTWIDMNSDWDYVYMDHEERQDYIFNTMPEIKNIYKYLSNPFKADIWRYLITYNNGGVYADMDSICLKPLNEMIQKYNDSNMVCFAPVNNFVNNSNFACIKNSKIIGKVLKHWRYMAIHFDESKNTFFNSYLFNSTVTPILFSDNVLKNNKSISFNMDQFAFHSLNFKFDGFNQD